MGAVIDAFIALVLLSMLVQVGGIYRSYRRNLRELRKRSAAVRAKARPLTEDEEYDNDYRKRELARIIAEEDEELRWRCGLGPKEKEVE